LWEQEIDHQRNVREYLTDDVLTTNGRAVVWWLAQHTDDIPGAVERIGHLSRLSAVSQGRDDVMVPHLVSAQSLMRDGDDRDITLTRELLHELFPNSSAERALFARRLAQLAEKSGQHRYGRRLRETFGVQDVQEAPPDPDDGEPTGA
jgi:hypothetical protein